MLLFSILLLGFGILLFRGGRKKVKRIDKVRSEIKNEKELLEFDKSPAGKGGDWSIMFGSTFVFFGGIGTISIIYSFINGLF